jgi:hypothetical protein
MKIDQQMSPVFLLFPTQSQKSNLIETVRLFNSGCQFVRDTSLELNTLNKIAIQPSVYRWLRSEYNLSAQMSVRAIAVGVELAKEYVRSYSPHWRNRVSRATGRPEGNLPPVADDAPMPIDDLTASFPNPFYASIRTIIQREKISMMFCGYGEREDNWPFALLIRDTRQPDGEVFWVHLPPPIRHVSNGS